MATSSAKVMYMTLFQLSLNCYFLAPAILFRQRASVVQVQGTARSFMFPKTQLNILREWSLSQTVFRFLNLNEPPVFYWEPVGYKELAFLTFHLPFSSFLFSLFSSLFGVSSFFPSFLPSFILSAQFLFCTRAETWQPMAKGNRNLKFTILRENKNIISQVLEMPTNGIWCLEMDGLLFTRSIHGVALLLWLRILLYAMSCLWDGAVSLLSVLKLCFPNSII